MFSPSLQTSSPSKREDKPFAPNLTHCEKPWPLLGIVVVILPLVCSVKISKDFYSIAFGFLNYAIVDLLFLLSLKNAEFILIFS